MQGEVARVRNSGLERLDELPESAGPLPALLPPAFGVFDEALIVAQVRLAVLGPEALGPAEGGDAAFGGEAGPDEGDDVAGGGDESRGVFDGAIEVIITLALRFSKGYSLTKLTMTVRSWGPSNSARKMPCQRPSARRPFSTGM